MFVVNEILMHALLLRTCTCPACIARMTMIVRCSLRRCNTPCKAVFSVVLLACYEAALAVQIALLPEQTVLPVRSPPRQLPSSVLLPDVCFCLCLTSHRASCKGMVVKSLGSDRGVLLFWQCGFICWCCRTLRL